MDEERVPCCPDSLWFAAVVSCRVRRHWWRAWQRWFWLTWPSFNGLGQAAIPLALWRTQTMMMLARGQGRFYTSSGASPPIKPRVISSGVESLLAMQGAGVRVSDDAHYSPFCSKMIVLIFSTKTNDR